MIFLADFVLDQCWSNRPGRAGLSGMLKLQVLFPTYFSSRGEIQEIHTLKARK